MKAFLCLWLDRLARWIRDVLGTESNQSSMRFVLLGAWVSVLFVFVFLSLKNGKMERIEETVLAMLGVATTGKCVEKHFETREP